MVGGIWFAIGASVKVPMAIRQRLVRDGAGIAAAADFREKMAGIGGSAWTASLAEFQSFIRADLAQWDADIRRLSAPAR